MKTINERKPERNIYKSQGCLHLQIVPKFDIRRILEI